MHYGLLSVSIQCIAFNEKVAVPIELPISVLTCSYKLSKTVPHGETYIYIERERDDHEGNKCLFAEGVALS